MAVAVACAGLSLVLAVAMLGISGYFVYTKSRIDPVARVDAIVVLGGDHDGRQEYGIELAQQGISRNVVLSDWLTGAEATAKYCAIVDTRFVVRCVRPVPSTTRGEALFTRRLAAENGWTSILVISWRYHLPRARYIFGQCFEGEIRMRPVPRDYRRSLAAWEYTYLYQTFGFAKAFLQGPC